MLVVCVFEIRNARRLSEENRFFLRLPDWISLITFPKRQRIECRIDFGFTDALMVGFLQSKPKGGVVGRHRGCEVRTD
jgi:hypothetical protein